MQIVSEKVVANYRWNKHEGVYRFWAMTGFFILIVVLFAVGRFTDWNRFGCMGAGLLLLTVWMVVISSPLPWKIDTRNPFYPLLELWEKFSGMEISQFPTSEVQIKLFAPWARRTLVELAQQATAAYDEQEGYHRRSIEAEFNAIPGSVTLKSWATGWERVLASVDATAKITKEDFLGFWDLVTEKNGIGILEGAEFQDPEIFRKAISNQSPRKDGPSMTVYA